MRKLLATRYYIGTPRYQPGCDGWVDVRTGKTGTWERKEKTNKEKEKGK